MKKIKYKAPGVTIYLRENGKKRWWEYYYRYVDRHGVTKAVNRSAKTNELKLAKARALESYRAKIADSGPSEFESKREAPTIQEIVKCYWERIGQEVSLAPRTIDEQGKALIKWVTLALGDPRRVRVDELDAEAVRKWRVARYAQRGLKFGQDKDLRLNYSLNSVMQNVKAVFSKAALRLYKQVFSQDIDVSEWKAVPRLKQAGQRYEPLDAGVVAAMDRDRFELPAEQRVAYELARFCALTKKEILGIRWNWIEDGPAIHVRYRPADPKRGIEEWESKHNAKNGRVRISEAMVAAWRTLVPSNNPTGHLIPAKHETGREQVIRALNVWLSGYIKGRSKKLHELRKHAGSEVLMRNKNPYEAAQFIRDSLETTLKHYASLLEDVAALDPYEQEERRAM